MHVIADALHKVRMTVMMVMTVIIIALNQCGLLLVSNVDSYKCYFPCTSII
jgi:hypothetical protein